MDILKIAGQRAGRRAAAYRVLVPMTLALALVFGAIMLAGALDYPVGNTRWPFMLLVGIMAAIPILVFVVHSSAKRSPQLILKELESMIRGEEMMISIYEAAIARLTKQKQDLESGLSVNESRQETSKRTLARRVADIEKSLHELRKIYEGASGRLKLRQQERFLGIQAQIREHEDRLQRLKDPTNNPPLLPAREHVEILLERRCAVLAIESEFMIATMPLWQQISKSRKTIEEANQAIQRLTT